MTEEQFLMWLPHAQAWLKRHLRYGLELRAIGEVGSGSTRQMIQTPDFVTRFDPLTAVASLVGPRTFYDVSEWGKAVKDLGLPELFCGRLFATIYDEKTFYDPDLRTAILACLF